MINPCIVQKSHNSMISHLLWFRSPVFSQKEIPLFFSPSLAGVHLTSRDPRGLLRFIHIAMPKRSSIGGIGPCTNAPKRDGDRFLSTWKARRRGQYPMHYPHLFLGMLINYELYLSCTPFKWSIQIMSMPRWLNYPHMSLGLRWWLFKLGDP